MKKTQNQKRALKRLLSLFEDEAAPIYRAKGDTPLCNAAQRVKWRLGFGNATSVAANEALSPEIAANADTVCAANERDQGDYLISPYGRYPHAAGFVQIFDRAAAETVVAQFNSLWQKLKNALGFGVAVPVYRGHPDDDLFEARPEHVDKAVYGKVLALRAADDGLHARIQWADGFDALPKGLHFSPRWLGRKSADQKTLSPMRLLSIGLTSHPNIAGTSAANEIYSTTPSQDKPMTKEMLIALGYTEQEAEAITNKTEGAPAEADILARITALADKAREADRNKAAADVANTEAEEKKKEALAAKACAANERAARAALVLRQAVAANAITEAERPSYQKLLESTGDFEALANEILKRSTGLHASQETAGAARRKDNGEATSARRTFEEAVAANERKGLSRAEAWAKAKNENPDAYTAAFNS